MYIEKEVYKLAVGLYIIQVYYTKDAIDYIDILFKLILNEGN